MQNPKNMKLKANLLLLLLVSCTLCVAQDWKTYPHTPTGSLVSFAIDEGRHALEPIEWWYTSGQITGDTSGKTYSYMLTYFYYPQSGFDGFRILNITDHSNGEFYQDVKPVNYTTLSTSELDIEASVFLGGTEYWRNKEDSGNNAIPFEYEVFASTASVTLDIELVTTKRPLILGDDGYLDQGSVNYTYYYSQTENDLVGSFTFDGTTENITGTAWIDRQYGDFNPLTGEKYEWFSLKLSNGMDINLWNIFTPNRMIPDIPEYRILSAYVDESTQYTEADFEIERLQFFCTTDEVNCYSKQWRLTSAINNLDLTITSLFETTEVQLPFRFFEGALSITGTVNGLAVTGEGFAELLHYYEHPDISLTSPTGGIYDTSVPISWDLNNPDDGRPVFYDLEYSIDNQNSFLPIVSGLTDPTYLWENPSINQNDDVWFKVISYSVDGVLTSTIISDSSSSATLSLQEFNPNGVKLYPNPVANRLFLQFDNQVSDLSYEIIDINGRIIFNNERRSTNLVEINTSALQQGVYFIRIYSDSVEDFLKFIKK